MREPVRVTVLFLSSLKDYRRHGNLSPNPRCRHPYDMTYYLLSIDDWTDFWDLNIPDTAWHSLGQNADLDTLIEITDPIWNTVIHHAAFDFLTPIWIQ
jgi:hypothetical protein